MAASEHCGIHCDVPHPDDKSVVGDVSASFYLPPTHSTTPSIDGARAGEKVLHPDMEGRREV